MKQSIALFSLLQSYIEDAETIVIGAGAGLSTAAGLTYEGERFDRYFSDMIKRYHFQDMYSAGFYPFPTLETYWAYWSRHIYYNRYAANTNGLYERLLSLLNNKSYFVITTNVDHQFQLAGFDEQRLFCTQGDYGLFQCSRNCHHQTYDNERVVREMVKKQRDGKIPKDLIPYCPICHAPMCVNLRCDETFTEDENWQAAAQRYQTFLADHATGKVLYLEMGVGYNTPGIIKYPFWRFTIQNPQAFYISINQEKMKIPNELQPQSLFIQGDLAELIED